MRLILFQLLTGFTIGSKVIFQRKVYNILDFVMITPFRRKSSIFKGSWRRPIQFVLIAKTRTGGIETFNVNVVKSVFEAGHSYHEIKSEV